jgi:GT2 family glycosyltransferase
MAQGQHPHDEAPADASHPAADQAVPASVSVGAGADSAIQASPDPAIHVSIVIPTYNRATRLRACLESVCNGAQTGQEIVVVDDGSTDETPEIVKAFGPAVRYFRQQNAGPSAARNAGVRAARGRYIAFLDSDDRLLPEPRQRVVQFLDRHPDVAVVFTDALVEDAAGGSSRAFRRPQLETFWALPHEATPEGLRVFDRASFLRAMILDRCYLVPSISVIRRAAFETSGLFDERLIGYEEWDLFVRLAAAFPFAYLDEPAAVIEKHESNLSGDLEKMVVSGVRVLDKLLEGAVVLPDDLRRATADKMRSMSFDAAYHAFVRGDAATARERFAAHMKRWGTTLPALAYWSGTWLPSRQVQRLREWKARLAR